MGTTGHRRPICAALYTRVPTRAQADKHGSAYQREALQRLADARDWQIVHIYADEGYSGRRTSRPALDEMMLAVRRGEIDVVAVWRWDRLFRSLRHMVETLQELQARNVDLVSHQEGTDTSTPMGRAMFQIAAAMSEGRSEPGPGACPSWRGRGAGPRGNAGEAPGAPNRPPGSSGPGRTRQHQVCRNHQTWLSGCLSWPTRAVADRG